MGQSTSAPVPLLTDDFMGTQTGIASPMNYMFGCNGMGSPSVLHDGNGKLELRSQFNDPVSDYCVATSAVTDYSFNNPEILDAGGFQVSVDIAWSDDPTSGFAIGLGEEINNDPMNFDPTPSVDAMVDVVNDEAIVRLFDNGTIISVNSFTIGIPISELENVTLDVETDDFGPDGQASLTVIVNGTAIPPLGFTWDGGSNYIEIRGGTTGTEPAMVAIDNLVIRPR